MKYIYKIWPYMVVLMLGFSCADTDRLEFDVEKPESIAMQEDIDSYADLKSFIDRTTNPNFKLGAGITLSDYISQNLIYRLVNRNFDEMTMGYAMKHGAIVQSNGNLDLDNVNELLAKAEEANVSVFGHTLCWHANQNAGYLNGLIQPLMVKPPAIANSLDLSSLQNGDFTNWGTVNNGAGISVENGMGLTQNLEGLKLVSSSGSASPKDLELVTPDIEIVEGHIYEVLFYIKSDKPGEGRVSFEGLINNEPELDWTGSGGQSETFQTSSSWQEVRFQISDFEANNFKAHLDLGYLPDVTYYIDVNNFFIYDTQGEVPITNLIANSDFETGSSGWGGGWGANDEIGATEDGLGYDNSGKAFFMTNNVAGNFWESQSNYVLPEYLEVGKSYKLSFMLKAAEANLELMAELQSVRNANGDTDYKSNSYGTIYPTTEWTKVELTTTISGDNAEFRDRVVFSFGQNAGTVYIDNVVLADADGASVAESIEVEKLPEVKEEIIADALENWISQMVTNCSPYVKAWDVLNEPMDDGNPYELKTGLGNSNLAADDFYWQDYLGKNYGVEAFRLAREYGNADDKLFINDYNLEYSLDKCKGLIQYVEYIESEGQQVDGIGTQMHISINSNKENIAEMFQLLAATGKLIKVSELDVRVLVDNPSQEILQQQADMYKYVIDMYNQHIPVSQRYGVTVWGLIDSAPDANWLPGEKQGLWNLDYIRKPAYSSFADGLSDL